MAARLAQEQVTLAGLRISGCPNACGRHLVAEVGLEGAVRRLGDRLLPCFTVLIGGGHGALPGESGARPAALGTRLGTVPAKRIPELAVDLARGGDPATVVARYSVQTLPNPVPDDWFTDWGDQRPFSLAGLGQGECAAG